MRQAIKFRPTLLLPSQDLKYSLIKKKNMNDFLLSPLYYKQISLIVRRTFVVTSCTVSWVILATYSMSQGTLNVLRERDVREILGPAPYCPPCITKNFLWIWRWFTWGNTSDICVTIATRHTGYTPSETTNWLNFSKPVEFFYWFFILTWNDFNIPQNINVY